MIKEEYLLRWEGRLGGVSIPNPNVSCPGVVDNPATTRALPKNIVTVHVSWHQHLTSLAPRAPARPLHPGQHTHARRELPGPASRTGEGRGGLLVPHEEKVNDKTSAAPLVNNTRAPGPDPRRAAPPRAAAAAPTRDPTRRAAGPGPLTDALLSRH